MNEQECNCVRCGYCCTEMDIKFLDLLYPERFMSAQGYEFFKASGLDEAIKNNEMIKIIHNCQHLIGDNECGIEETKPSFCAEWICRRHMRDNKWFQDQLGKFALESITKIIDIIRTGEYDELPGSSNIIMVLKDFLNRKTNLEGGKGNNGGVINIDPSA